MGPRSTLPRPPDPGGGWMRQTLALPIHMDTWPTTLDGRRLFMTVYARGALHGRILPKRTCGMGGWQARGQLTGRYTSAARYALSPAAAQGRRHLRRTHVHLGRVHRSCARDACGRRSCAATMASLRVVNCPSQARPAPVTSYRSRRTSPAICAFRGLAMAPNTSRTHLRIKRPTRPTALVICLLHERRRHRIDLGEECTDGSRSRPPARLIVEVLCSTDLGRNSGSDPRPRKKSPAANLYSVEGGGASLRGRLMFCAHAARHSACTSVICVAPRVCPNKPPRASSLTLEVTGGASAGSSVDQLRLLQHGGRGPAGALLRARWMVGPAPPSTGNTCPTSVTKS